MKDYLKVILKGDYLIYNFLEEFSISLSIFYNFYGKHKIELEFKIN